jgi:VCBS repeat-containing protein
MLRNETPLKRAIALPVAIALLLSVFVAVSAPSANASYPGGNGAVVFENGFDLWSMPSDGTGAPTNLTTGVLSNITDPAVSPDGSQLAFSRDVLGVAGIWKAPFDASVPSIGVMTQVTSGPTDGAPTWSSDSASIAFTRKPILEEGTATTADPAGTTLTDVAATFQANGVVAGMTVKNQTSGGSGIVSSVTSDTVLVLTGALVGGDDALWEIGDAYRVISRRQIFSAAADGTTPGGTLLSASGASPTYDDSFPVWSPLGNKIAFETNRNGNADIFTMDSAGGSETNLTGAGAFDSNSNRPSWSPDGLRIAFQANEPNADSDIWTVNPSNLTDTTNVTSGFTSGDDDTEAAFSPDGLKIAFVRNGGRTSVIDADGSGNGLAVINGSAPAAHNQPDWQPAVVGIDDAYVVDEGGMLSPAAPGVLSNDGLVGALPAATAVNASTPSNGTVTLNPNGSFTYEHDGSNTLSDSFTYQPKQGSVTGSLATVNITVTPEDDAPVAENDGPYSVAFGGAVTITAPGVLGNDVDEGPLTAENASTPTHGTVVLALDGSFTYTHNGTSGSADSFTYQAKEAGGTLSNVATVSISIGGDPAAVHSTGLVDPVAGLWYLYDGSGALETSFYFGNPGDYPFMGDWDGDGVETPGLYRQADGFVYLTNSNAQGQADIRFFFGNPGDVPIAGDFNNDGKDTVSIYRPAEARFYIINELGSNDGGLGAADIDYVFGNFGDKPFVGDFDGDGVETVGLHRESTGLVYYINVHAKGQNAANQFVFGDPGDRLVAGDWTGDGMFSPGLFRPSNTTMFFKDENTQGNADSQFVPVPSSSGWIPVSGYR